MTYTTSNIDIDMTDRHFPLSERRLWLIGSKVSEVNCLASRLTSCDSLSTAPELGPGGDGCFGISCNLEIDFERP
jgi:hypothetical protein